jgi:ABC-type antimicrobial peptide transport system permease subunit
MKSNIKAEVAKVVEKLGYYDITPTEPLLSELEFVQLAVVQLTCVFNVLLILICAISVLLIYSLLMVSVTQKTFDTGVLRMVGVSKMDCILSITM